MKLESECCGVPLTVHTQSDGFLGIKPGELECSNCGNKWDNSKHTTGGSN